MHSLSAVISYFTGKALGITVQWHSSMAQFIACSRSPHNVIHSPSPIYNALCVKSATNFRFEYFAVLHVPVQTAISGPPSVFTSTQ